MNMDDLRTTKKKVFGYLEDGTEVELLTLANRCGMLVEVTSLDIICTSFDNITLIELQIVNRFLFVDLYAAHQLWCCS